MAKEMMIVFVYDTARCNKEDDDPADAVLYFHPAWVSPTQRLALAGQLMGVNQFLTVSFAPPSLISLQGGKFVLKKFGTYILAVGTDRNIHDWILERRAEILESLLKFFHCDFNTISTSLNGDQNKLTEKLYQIFETYLPILQYSANLFSNNPTLKLPRSASNIFLEAVQLLQLCQETSAIMGGCIFYNNKVVASQLNAQITKQLILTDPYRIKAPAEKITTTFHLPVGVQLLRIYVDQNEYTKMSQDANLKRMYNSNENKILRKDSTRSNIKEQTVSLMKRDVSRIFTVPEDSELNTDHCSYQCHSHENSPAKQQQKESSERPKLQNPLTPSVCSTPLSNVNRILHGTAVSICSGQNERQNEPKSENSSDKEQANYDDIPDVVKEALRCKRLNKLRNNSTRQIRLERSQSLTDLDDTLNKFRHRVCLRTYGLGLPKLNKNLCVNYDEKPKTSKLPKKSHTIVDPQFPIFRCDGLPASNALYNEYISLHLADINEAQEKLQLLPISDEQLKEKSHEKEENSQAKPASKFSLDLDVRLENKSKQESYRRSMSLPLKPLNTLDGDDRRKTSSEVSSGMFERKKLGGLQLTPLMSKLSLLADERTSGFCSRDITPSVEFKDFSSSLSTTTKTFTKNQESNSEIDEDEDDATENSTSSNDGQLTSCDLFLCGHQNMVMALVMQQGSSDDPDLIHSLWKSCVNTLGKLETRLQKCLDPLPSTESKELYSVLSIDSQWDTVHRSGLWGVTELDIVSLLHDRLSNVQNITDIIVRTEDVVVYGNQCGKVQVFYQQALMTKTTGGLPTPADLMGVVPLKVKRRLERDHGIMLL